MAEVDWSSLVEALAQVERLGADESGLLAFGPHGGIFVERGRICWVAARGLQRRLRDLLRDSANIDAKALDRMYERCRREGLLLGQSLVAEGLLQPHELEAALRRHSAESLAHLCQELQPTSWSSHAGRGYAPRFTFTAVDLLFDTVNLFFPEQRALAQRALAEFGGGGRRSAAFALDAHADALLPLAATGGGDLGVLRSLGALARSLFQGGNELGATPVFALAASANSDATLVWSRDAVLYAVACEDRTSLVAATSRHLVEA